MNINLFFNSAYLSKIILTALLFAVFSLTAFAQKLCGEQDYDCMMRQSSKAIQMNPSDSEAYYMRATAYYNKSNFEPAISDYTKTLELNSEKYEVYDYRARAYYNLKRYDAAIADYNKSIELDPTYADSYINRGNVYDDAGNYAAAIKDYNAAIKLEPGNISAYYNRGIAQLHHNSSKQAISDFQKVLQLDPNNTEAQKRLGEAQTAKQEKDARSKAKWVAFGQLIDPISTESQQNTVQSRGAQSGTSGRTAGSQAAPTNRSAGGSPAEADVEAWVRAYEDEINPTGGVSSPLSISLSFNQISYGAVRAANEGDRLRHVKSDQLYMVTVDYTVNQKFSDGVHPKHKKWNFEFYVNTENGWSAFSYGPAQ